MLDPRYRMRAFTIDDLPAHLEILNQLRPDQPETLEQLLQGFKFVHTPPMVSRQVAVDEVVSGRLVAVGGMVTPPDGIGLGGFWVSAGVEPSHQANGIGQEITKALEGEARSLGAVRLFASTRVDDRRSVRFLLLQGFEEKLRNWQSILELASASDLPRLSEDALHRKGVEFTTLVEEGPSDPVVLDRVYALAAATLGDGPRMGAYLPPTRAQFAGMMLDTPGFLPEGFFLARSEGRYVGMSNLERIGAEPDRLHQVFTATLPSFRGRGIATELKRRGIEFARDRGYRFLVTENDSLNVPIWSINERLGYRRRRETIEMQKDLAPPPG